MYYLDYFSLHKRTTATSRVIIRKSLERDKEMAYKLKLQRNSCFYCGVSVDMASHLDHVIPIYYGGGNESRNLVAACKDCNLTKMTSQIEITNEHTIRDYKKLVEAHKKWTRKVRERTKTGKRTNSRWMPKRVRLYKVYRAYLFKEI